MAYTSQTTRIDSGASRAVTDIFAAFRAWRARRAVHDRTWRELNALSDRDLADLGISRADIGALARKAAARV